MLQVMLALVVIMSSSAYDSMHPLVSQRHLAEGLVALPACSPSTWPRWCTEERLPAVDHAWLQGRMATGAGAHHTPFKSYSKSKNLVLKSVQP
jgi:hypothetical protein